MSTGDDDSETPGSGDQTTEDAQGADAKPTTPSADATATGPEAADAAEPPPEEDPWPFDDDGVFHIRRREPIDLSAFSEGAPTQPEGLHFSGSEELTLDAFERAVSRAVHEKLASTGAEPSNLPPQGADELVASVLGALTGKNARAALDEVREHLAASKSPPEEHAGADIIDLQAAREARRRPAQSETAGKIGEVLKDTVNAFLGDVACQTGCATVNIDAAFLKTHGNALLGSLFQGLAQALLPQVAKLQGFPLGPTPGRGPVDVDELAEWEDGVGADDESAATAKAEAPAEPKAEAPAEAPATPPVAAPQSTAAPQPAGTPFTDTAAAQGGQPRARDLNVSVKIDLGSILANLFTRRPKP